MVRTRMTRIAIGIAKPRRSVLFNMIEASRLVYAVFEENRGCERCLFGADLPGSDVLADTVEMELEPANVCEICRSIYLCNCAPIDGEELPAGGVRKGRDKLLRSLGSIRRDFRTIEPDRARNCSRGFELVANPG